MTDDRPHTYSFPCPQCDETMRLVGGWPVNGDWERAYKCDGGHRLSTIETVSIPFCGKIGETAEAWNKSKPEKG